MIVCWAKNPDDRPTFTNLCEKIDEVSCSKSFESYSRETFVDRNSFNSMQTQWQNQIEAVYDNFKAIAQVRCEEHSNIEFSAIFRLANRIEREISQRTRNSTRKTRKRTSKVGTKSKRNGRRFGETTIENCFAQN